MTGKRILLQREVGRRSRASLKELQNAFAPWLNLTCLGKSTRDCLLTWPRVFLLFLSQVLSADGSCREAVQKFLAWLALEEGRQASPNTAAYCKSRARLPMEKMEQLHKDMVNVIQDSYRDQGTWHERPVKVVDGSGLSMPDTLENQQVFPQSKRAAPGCGFPQMRITALFSLATGVLLKCCWASRYVSERAMFRLLWESLVPGDIVLADRGFCGFVEFFLLLQRGGGFRYAPAFATQCWSADHQEMRSWRHVGPMDKNEALPHGVYQGTMGRDPFGPGCTAHLICSRSARISESEHHYRHYPYRLQAIPAAAFAELYRRRWSIELYFRDIKISMGMDVLRCLTPKMVQKEVMMYIIAYNLIRATMLEASQATQRVAERISFKDTCQALREWTPIFAIVITEEAKVLYRAMLQAIGSAPLPHRPDRSEPRARKRRPKNYQLLNKPRHQFKEIPHRGKYVKQP